MLITLRQKREVQNEENSVKELFKVSDIHTAVHKSVLRHNYGSDFKKYKTCTLIISQLSEQS